MATVQLDFKNINDSLQVNDTVYYCVKENIGGFSVSEYSQITRLGKCTHIYSDYIWVETDSNVNLPTVNDYIFFTKDNEVNLSSLKGYYAEVKFKNDSNVKSELFQVGLSVNESSK